MNAISWPSRTKWQFAFEGYLDVHYSIVLLAFVNSRSNDILLLSTLLYCSLTGVDNVIRFMRISLYNLKIPCYVTASFSGCILRHGTKCFSSRIFSNWIIHEFSRFLNSLIKGKLARGKQISAAQVLQKSIKLTNPCYTKLIALISLRHYTREFQLQWFEMVFGLISFERNIVSN